MVAAYRKQGASYGQRGDDLQELPFKAKAAGQNLRAADDKLAGEARVRSEVNTSQ